MAKGVFERTPEILGNLREFAIRNGLGKHTRTPEILRHQSDSATEAWKNKTTEQREIEREHNRQAQFKRYENPEEHIKSSNAHIVSYEDDPTIADRIGKGVRKAITPEICKRHREFAREMWARPNYHKAHSGENHPFWRGGQQEGYGCGWWSIRKVILERDKYTCQLCGTKEHRSVHHIDYVKSNIKENNLITLCESCNMRANFDREYWTSYFKNKMDEGFSLSNLSTLIPITPP